MRNHPCTVAMIGALVYEHGSLEPILAENLEEMDGVVLPHLILSDVVRWTVAHVRDEPTTCRGIWEWLGRAYLSGTEPVRNLIWVSDVEMLPDPQDPGGAELRGYLSPELREIDYEYHPSLRP